MSEAWVIELDTGAPERARADLLVAPVFEAERPLRGAAGRLDWRLCGHLSEMLARSAFAGAEGETVLVPLTRRARSPRGLLLGVGARSGFGPGRLRQAARLAIAGAGALRSRVVAVALPTEAGCGVPVERTAAAVLVGAGEALAEHPFTLRLRLIVEPAGAARARRVLSDLVPRIELEGVIARLSAPEAVAESVPVGHEASEATSVSGRGAAAPPQPKLPSVP
jgi:hypothetical protein